MANEKEFITLVTNIGKTKFINASVLGKKVNLTTIKVGDGNGASYTPVETQTDLKNVVWQGAINSMEVDTENPNAIKIDSIIPSSDGGFFIREIGIYDDLGDLIIITKYKETYKPIAANGSVMELLLRTTLVLSNLDTIQLKIDPYVAIATKKDIENLSKKIDGMKLESTAIDVVDTANNFTADTAGKKLLEDVLVQINTKVKANSTELGTNKTDLYNSQVGIVNALLGKS